MKVVGDAGGQNAVEQRDRWPSGGEFLIEVAQRQTLGAQSWPGPDCRRTDTSGCPPGVRRAALQARAGVGDLSAVLPARRRRTNPKNWLTGIDLP